MPFTGFNYNGQEFPLGNPLVVTVDFTSSTWNTVGLHKLFNVSGLNLIRTCVRCMSPATSSGAMTISIGTSASPANIYLATGKLPFITNGLWNNTGTLKTCDTYANVVKENIISNQNIFLSVNVAAATGGLLEVYLFFLPFPDVAGSSVNTITVGDGASS